MNRYILMPDSFKGTMSSATICQIRRFEPDAEIVSIPVADGGEGSVDAFLTALGGEKRVERVTGPLGKTVDSFWGLLQDGKTAVIEMAAAAGLPQVGSTPDAAGATTYGVGELIRHALKVGCTKLILGLGGSATTDGGCGMAAALGVVFRDEQGKAFVPVGGTLHRIHSVDLDGLDPRLAKMEIVAMCEGSRPSLCRVSGSGTETPGADHAGDGRERPGKLPGCWCGWRARIRNAGVFRGQAANGNRDGFGYGAF